MTTNYVGGSSGWSVNDEVVQLREWGSPVAHPLPAKHARSTIGSSEDCWLRLRDPAGSVSRIHAVLTHGEYGWLLSDLGSKNGVFLDGARVSAIVALPGVRIRIGKITLVAESPKLVALRNLLERFLGWSDDRREAVDQALYSMRIAATQREPLLLRGDGNLVPVARQLHHHALAGRPFVVAKPGARRAKGMVSLAEAAGGTLCVLRREQPEDFDEVASALQGPAATALLMICGPVRSQRNDIVSRIVTSVRSIDLPPLSRRKAELRRIIDAYAQDAITDLGGGSLTRSDREWVESEASGSFGEVWKATRRLVALRRCAGKATRAAELLSISQASLSDWIASRSLRGKSDPSDGEAPMGQ